MEHTLHNLKDALTELRETNNSLLSTKQNEVMRTLTVLNFVFLPLLFLSGLTTLYFSFVSIGTQSFWILVGIMLLLGVISLLYFKRRGWL